MGLSRREFAGAEGCSEGAVRYALRQGRLAARPDGTLDPSQLGRAVDARLLGREALGVFLPVVDATERIRRRSGSPPPSMEVVCGGGDPPQYLGLSKMGDVDPIGLIEICDDLNAQLAEFWVGAQVGPRDGTR